MLGNTVTQMVELILQPGGFRDSNTGGVNMVAETPIGAEWKGNLSQTTGGSICSLSFDEGPVGHPCAHEDGQPNSSINKMAEDPMLYRK